MAATDRPWADKDYIRAYAELGKLWPVRLMRHIAIERLGATSGHRVLDLGCGPGSLLQAYNEHKLKVHPTVVGLDKDPYMLGQARTIRYGGKATFYEADLNKPANAWGLPEDTRAFDAVVAINSLYILDDPREVLRQAATWAGRRATLVVSTPKNDAQLEPIFENHLNHVRRTGGDVAAQRAWIKAAFEQANHNIRQRDDFHFPDKEQFRDWFTDTGWRLRVVRDVYAKQNWLGFARREE